MRFFFFTETGDTSWDCVGRHDHAEMPVSPINVKEPDSAFRGSATVH